MNEKSFAGLQQEHSLPTPETSAGTGIPNAPGRFWWKIPLFVVIGLIFAGGLIIIGYQLGQREVTSSVPSPKITESLKYEEKAERGSFFPESENNPSQPAPTQELDLTPTPSLTPISVPDPIANWKTYTNTNLGVSFKYPMMDIEIIECNSESIFVVKKDRQYDPCRSEPSGFFIMLSNENYREGLPGWYYRDYEINASTIVIDGKTATRYTGTRTSTTPAPIPSDIDMIVFLINGESLLVNQPDDQIISTFRFLN